MKKRIFLLLVMGLGVGIFLYFTHNATPMSLTLVTTTSTVDTGLLDTLVPIFEKEHNCKVRVIAAGTGAAIRQGKDGNADVVLVHDPQAEESAVKEGFFVERRYVMYNDFVLLGPPEDPAGIRGLTDAVAALRKIHATAAVFISRADQSGTHKKELSLWAETGLLPKGAWYREAGTGMGALLRMAHEKKAYCLSDRGTYLSQEKRICLRICVAGDKRLFNPYHVMLVSPLKYPGVHHDLAQKFARFLLTSDTQKRIGAFGVEKCGSPLFYKAAD